VDDALVVCGAERLGDVGEPADLSSKVDGSRIRSRSDCPTTSSIAMNGAPESSPTS
jgi:hypothetical protein